MSNDDDYDCVIGLICGGVHLWNKYRGIREWYVP